MAEDKFEFHGPISSKLFLKILTEWRKYLESGSQEDKIVEIEEDLVAGKELFIDQLLSKYSN